MRCEHEHEREAIDQLRKAPRTPIQERQAAVSRKLDALFAERVLGLKRLRGNWTNVFGSFSVERWVPRDSPDEVDCEWEETINGGRLKFPGIELPPYTTSLDAAWAGVAAVRPGRLISVDFVDTADGWCCELSTNSTIGSAEFVAHPAEALVLAALRAVGVPEAEIEEAR